MKKIVLSFAVFAFAFIPGVTFSQGIDRNPSTVTASGRTVVVPDVAVNNPSGLERAIYIHRKDGFAKPNAPGSRKVPACYGVLSKGAKLKTAESLTVHPSIDAATIATSTNTWDTQTSESLFSSYTVDASANWDGSAPDGRNELSYGNYSEPGVIAITVVWGYFSGPISKKQITEFDILFDTDYAWGDAASNPAIMDLENIATHEIGHGVGLADVYDSSCGQVTMYGYSDYGDTAKRSLEPQDITGLRSLYGI